MEYHISGWEDYFVKKWQTCDTESIVLQHNSSTSKHLNYKKKWQTSRERVGWMEGKLGIYENKNQKLTPCTKISDKLKRKM